MFSNFLVVIAAATFVATLFHFLKLPAIVAFITAGILIGPSCLGWVQSTPQAGLLTELSAVLLMFTIGLEFSLKELLRFRRPLLFLGVGQVVFSVLIFSLLFWLVLPINADKAIFLSFLVALSSTAVVLKLLQDHREFETPYGRASFSVLLAQDLAVIPMIIAVPFLTSKESITSNILDSLFPFLLLTSLVSLLLFLANKYALPFLFDRVSKTKNREIFFFTVLLVCASCAGLMHQIGLSVSLGAFIAGMLIGGSVYGKQATAQILPLRDAFLSLFFVSIGLLLDLKFLFHNFHQVLLFGIAVIFVKSLIIFTLVWFSGNSGAIARATTVLLFQFGEFSFILADLGLKNGLITENDRQYFVATGILSLMATPLLFTRIQKIIEFRKAGELIPHRIRGLLRELRHQFQMHLWGGLNLSAASSEQKRQDHVIIAGYGIGGQSLSRVLFHLNFPFTVIEMNPDTVKNNKDSMDIVFGDAALPEILHKVGIEKAKIFVLLTSGGQTTANTIAAIQNANPTLPIIVRINYLRELDRLPRSPQIHYVVGEFESALEVIQQTLQKLEHNEVETQTIVNELRFKVRDLQVD